MTLRLPQLPCPYDALESHIPAALRGGGRHGRRRKPGPRSTFRRKILDPETGRRLLAVALAAILAVVFKEFGTWP